MEETYTLDALDKKILSELQSNARQSIEDIAKKTKTQRNVVKYRISRLEERKIIQCYNALIDPKKLGYNIYVFVGFSLLSLKPEDEKQLVNFLVQLDQVSYVSKSSGKWDFVVGIVATDYTDFDEVLKQIRNKFNHLIKDFDVAPIIKDYKYYFGVL